MPSITKRYREARGLHANTDTYAFLARMGVDDKAMLRAAQEHMAASMGGTPSNPVLTGELLRVYLSHVS